MAENHHAHYDTLKEYGCFDGEVLIRQILERKKQQGDHSGLVIHKNIKITGDDNKFIMPLPAGKCLYFTKK